MEKLCPVCSLPMIPQLKKANAKAPDWKCQDTNCKFSWDQGTQTYQPSNFITGVWNAKASGIAPRQTRPALTVSNTVQTSSNADVIKLLQKIYDLLDRRLPADNSEPGEDELRQYGL